MNAPLKITKGSGNVFRDLGFSEGEAQNLLLRTDLMIKIEQLIKKSGLIQSEAAKVLGITQPRVNDLLKVIKHEQQLAITQNRDHGIFGALLRLNRHGQGIGQGGRQRSLALQAR